MGHGVLSLAFFLQLFPFFALSVAFVLYDLTIYLHRKNKPTKWATAGAGGILVLLTALWGFYRGDINSSKWANGKYNTQRSISSYK